MAGQNFTPHWIRHLPEGSHNHLKTNIAYIVVKVSHQGKTAETALIPLTQVYLKRSTEDAVELVLTLTCGTAEDMSVDMSQGL